MHRRIGLNYFIWPRYIVVVMSMWNVLVLSSSFMLVDQFAMLVGHASQFDCIILGFNKIY